MVEGRATEADTLAALALPAPPVSTHTLVTPGTAPRGATTQTLATPTATARGLPTGAEATMEAEGMPEAEATAESEAAATTREVSPAEGEGGPGTAGKAASLKVLDENPLRIRIQHHPNCSPVYIFFNLTYVNIFVKKTLKCRPAF